MRKSTINYVDWEKHSYTCKACDPAENIDVETIVTTPSPTLDLDVPLRISLTRRARRLYITLQ